MILGARRNTINQHHGETARSVAATEFLALRFCNRMASRPSPT
jgi:hypothetical protein